MFCIIYLGFVIKVDLLSLRNILVYLVYLGCAYFTTLCQFQLWSACCVGVVYSF